jgi:hypothetical protein
MAILNRGMAGAPQALQMAYMRDPRMRLAQQLQAGATDTSPVGHWSQGLARLAQALAGNRLEDKADSEYRGQAEAYQNDMRGFMAPVMEQNGGAMRPANYGELSERAARFASPYSVEAARPLMQAAMQREAEAAARGTYSPVTDNSGNVIGQRNSATGKIDYVPAGMLDQWEPAAGPGGLQGQRNKRTGEWKPADMRPVTNVNTNVQSGPQGPQFGPIDKGYAMRQNPDGSYEQYAVPGGPAALEEERRRRAESEGTRQQAQSADIVTGDITRAISLMNSAVLPTTGAIGGALSGVGGTSARDVAGLLDTIKANTAFDKLAEMRKASPTGAALGSVTERELALLAAVRGNLEQSQSDAQLRYNLARLNNTVLDIVHGPSRGPARMQLGRAEQGAAGPRGAPPRPQAPPQSPVQGQAPDINSLLDRYAPR